MNRYQAGTIFELYTGRDYIVVDNMNKGENEYILSAPVYYEGKKLKPDFSKLLLVKVNNETDEMDIETDEKIIEETIRNSVDKIKA